MKTNWSRLFELKNAKKDLDFFFFAGNFLCVWVSSNETIYQLWARRKTRIPTSFSSLFFRLILVVVVVVFNIVRVFFLLCCCYFSTLLRRIDKLMSVTFTVSCVSDYFFKFFFFCCCCCFIEDVVVVVII